MTAPLSPDTGDRSPGVRLGVNIDHIATLRQARRGAVPDPVEAALVCEQAGASSIVCHLREDRRHIQDYDVRQLKRTIRTRLNLEMSIAKSVVAVALEAAPQQVTLVPERRQELTTEGGLDVVRLLKWLRPLVKTFQSYGIEVSLFIDPSLAQVEASHKAGATIIELHTGAYANAATPSAWAGELETLERAAAKGRGLGLAVAAGHGLNYENVRSIVELPTIEELNIGFSIVTWAVSVGLSRAVEDMVELLQRKERHAFQPAA